MSRSETIQPPIEDKFKPLTVIKRGHMNTRLPRKLAETNAKLAAAVKRKAQQ